MSKIPSLPAGKIYLFLDLTAIGIVLIMAGLSLNAVIRSQAAIPQPANGANPQQQVIDQALEKLSNQVID